MTDTRRIRHHNLDSLLEFVDHLDQLDRAHPVEPDGHRTHTAGGEPMTRDYDTARPSPPCNADPDCTHVRPCPDHDTLTPVEATVHARTQPVTDPVATLTRQAHRATQHLADALDELNDIRNAFERVQGRTLDQDHTDQWCRLHLRYTGAHEERYRGDQCRPCYDFTRITGIEPTREIINHADRRGWSRIPRNLIDQAKADRDTKTKPKKKRKR